MNLFDRLRTWFASFDAAPELRASEPSSVDVLLDEGDLFEEHTESTIRLKVSGVRTRAFKPSSELLALDEEREDEVTRPVDVRALLAASDDER